MSRLPARRATSRTRLLHNSFNPKKPNWQPADDHGALVKVIPRRGEMTEFKPGRHGVTVAALDWGIKEAKRIRDWPALETAVDAKIAEQCKFFAWWGATVRGAGQPQKNSPGSRLIPCPEAEALTGMRQQRVSDLGKQLAHPDKYRLRLLGAAYRAAMLDDKHDHHDGDEWGTPVEIIEPVRAFFGGQIECDPASNETAQKTVRAIQYFTKEQDGLVQEWRGKTFLNGPYSNIAPWVNKLISEYNAGHVTEAICLTNACTDTEWFDRLRGVATAICFTRGRIRFIDAHGNEATGSPPVGQALFYLGPRPDEFARQFSAVGWVVDPTRYRDLAAHREEVATAR